MLSCLPWKPPGSPSGSIAATCLRASNKTPITINITGTVPYQPWGGAGAYTAPRETRYSGKFMRRSKS